VSRWRLDCVIGCTMISVLWMEVGIWWLAMHVHGLPCWLSKFAVDRDGLGLDRMPGEVPSLADCQHVAVA
jgi:hypothetical protein